MHMHDQETCAGTGDEANLHTYSLTKEDRVCLFHCTITQHISGENRNLGLVLPPRATCVVATRLQEALLGATGHLFLDT